MCEWYSGKEDGTHPHERRALLDGDSVVLARAHRELVQTVLGGELPQSAEVRTRRLRVVGEGWHRHQSAHARVELEERREGPRRYARLRLLPAQVDLDKRRDRELRGRRLRVERMAELAERVH